METPVALNKPTLPAEPVNAPVTATLPKFRLPSSITKLLQLMPIASENDFVTSTTLNFTLICVVSSTLALLTILS